MTIHCLPIASVAVLCLLIPSGCDTLFHVDSRRDSELSSPASPANIQIAAMGFADRYVSAMADVYDKVSANAPTPEAAAEAQTAKIQAAIGALGNAVNPNPLAGLMDMAILVTLTREITDEPWYRKTFGPEGVTLILGALQLQEADVWRVVGNYLTADQLSELRQLAANWRRNHPDQRYLAGVRLSSFSQADRAGSTNAGLASSIFGIIRLDPFAGLDPAVRQIEESRVLGERVFYYMRHATMLFSWQADALYMKMLDAPQITQVLGDTTAFAETTRRFTDNAARFTDATREFADASSRVAATVEKFRAELPAQQATLMEQLNDLVARQSDQALKQASAELTLQSDAALKQAAAEIAAERKAAIDQLNASADKQQALIAQNLEAIMDRSIDRLYARARTLILIAIAGVLAAVLLFAHIIPALRRRASSPKQSAP